MISESKERLAQQALMDLPTEISDLVDFFVQKGIRGTRGNAMCCPVSVYLTQKTGTPTAVAGDVYLLPNASGMQHALPTAVKEMIKLFDRGHLPALEEKSLTLR